MANNALPENYQPSQNFINQLRRLPCQPSQSISHSSRHSQTLSQVQGQHAIQQFRRDIQARFQISIANKIYSFPRRFNQISEIISSDEQQSDAKSQDDWEKSDEMTSYLKPKLQKQQYRFTTDRSGQRTNITHKKSSTNKSGRIKSPQNQKSQSRKKSKNSTKNSQRKRQQPERDVNASKRLNTEPNSINYIQTIRMKMQKRN